MRVDRSPSGIKTTREHGTSDTSLGDFDFSAITDAIKSVAPTAAQVYANQQQVKNQQAALIAQQRSALMMGQGGYYPSQRPAWLIPAAIGGGVLLLALTLRK